MRDCPAWFQDELARIGGVNPYGEPIFRLVWSTDERAVFGGHWEKDGFDGYREKLSVPGEPCWALMVWEPRESSGSYEQWNRDFRDEETGLMQCGNYPKYGHYRLMQKFIHREIVQQAKERHFLHGHDIRTELVQEMKTQTYRMEPCGFMLDIMLPMLMAWRRLSNGMKTAALRQQEQERKDEYAVKAKDAFDGMKLSRYMRGTQLVQKRAEVIERGMKHAMAIAAQSGLGMRLGA